MKSFHSLAEERPRRVSVMPALLCSGTKPDIRVRSVVRESGTEDLSRAEEDPPTVHPGPGHTCPVLSVDLPHDGHHQPEDSLAGDEQVQQGVGDGDGGSPLVCVASDDGEIVLRCDHP